MLLTRFHGKNLFAAKVVAVGYSQRNVSTKPAGFARTTMFVTRA
jgi:hypothetical protein